MQTPEALAWRRGRVACRIFHLHGMSCRGRRDHWPTSEVQGRWVRNRWL